MFVEFSNFAPMFKNRTTFTKRLLSVLTSVFLASTFSITAHAQAKMDTVFANMPDSIIPYLTKNNRLDCIDFIRNNMKAEVENLFETKSELTDLTDNYLRMKLNSITTLELKLFTVDGKDSIICMSKTILMPEPDSEVSFFNLEWQPMEIPFDLKQSAPATATTEPTLNEAVLSKDGETITIKRHRIFSKDKELNSTTTTSRVYKWNGKTLEQEL